MCSLAATLAGPRPPNPAAASPPAAALGQGDLAGDGDQQPGAEHLDEVAPREAPGESCRSTGS